MTENKNTLSSRVTRERKKKDGMKEMRGITCTEREEVLIKPVIRLMLKLLREEKEGKTKPQ